MSDSSEPLTGGKAVKTAASYTSFILQNLHRIDEGLEPVSDEEGHDALLRTINLATRDSQEPLNIANYRANSARLKAGRGISEIQDLSRGRPVFLVGAGPSLDKNGAELKRVADKNIIVACDAALPILDKLGIEPDYVMVIDTKACQGKFWAGRKPGKTKLLVVACAHPEALESWQGDILYFNTWGDAEDEALQLEVGKDFGSIGVGGNVSTGMLWLAVTFLGASAVVMVGHDFSYPSIERYYAKGGTHELAAVNKHRFYTWDIYGRTVQTDLSLKSYKIYTERWIRDLKAGLSEIGSIFRFINASEGGTLGTTSTPGVLNQLLEYKALGDVIDELQSQPSDAALGLPASLAPEAADGAIAAAG